MAKDWEYAELIGSAEIEKDRPRDAVYWLDAALITLICVLVAVAIVAGVWLFATFVLSGFGAAAMAAAIPLKTRHQPVTPLPWKVSSDAKLRIIGYGHQAGTGECVNDALYIAHAANAYPKLVEALRRAASNLDDAANTGTYDRSEKVAIFGRANNLRALLRSLGEEA